MEKKLFFLFLAILIFTSIGAAEIYYSVDAEKDSLNMNTTVKMDCDEIGGNCPVSLWTLTLNKPENATVTGVESSMAEVNKYDVSGDRITIETSSDEPRESVSILLKYKIDSKADHIKDNLYYHQIGLPGFQGEKNYGEIRAEDIIHADVSHGFKSSLNEDSFQFTGSGPANAHINFGEGHRTDYFEFFGGEPEGNEKAYEITAGILGFYHRFDRLPVVMLNNREYNETVNRWSRGQYTRGRLLLRKDLDEEFIPILAHEAVHAFNDEPLEWDKTSSSYFDEGTAKYVESMVRKTEIDHPTRELFGEDVSYNRETNGKKYRYTLPSKGDKEQLWQYYQEDSDFMKFWSAEQQNRAFGYAYSELIIRNYIANENGSIRQLYSELDREQEIEDPEQKWNHYSEVLDMTPCEYDSRDRFEQCLENINEYNYQIYRAQPRERSSNSLDIEKLNVSEPELTETEESAGDSSEDIVKKGYNETSDFDRKDITDMNQQTDKTGEKSLNSFLNRISQSFRDLISYIFHV